MTKKGERIEVTEFIRVVTPDDFSKFMKSQPGYKTEQELMLYKKFASVFLRAYHGLDDRFDLTDSVCMRYFILTLEDLFKGKDLPKEFWEKQ